MSHIPKKAQRAIEAANRAREVRRVAETGSPANQPLQTPKRLDTRTMPIGYCKLWDVYFNGEKQTLCRMANVETGEIIRFLHGRNGTPLPPYDTETLQGLVTIKRKGT